MTHQETHNELTKTQRNTGAKQTEPNQMQVDRTGETNDNQKGGKQTKTGSKDKTHEGGPRLQNKTGDDQQHCCSALTIEL